MIFFSRLWRKAVARPAVISSLIALAVGGAIGTRVSDWRRQGRIVMAASPAPTIDQRFVDLGKSYRPELGKAYAGAWDEGARALESGHDLTEALDVVSRAWANNRLEAYTRRLTPELARIVPEGSDHASLAPADLAAMAAAWRGLAVGLR